MSPTNRSTRANDPDVEDNWDKAVNSGGCVAENEKLLDCKLSTGDWRKCTEEMAAFKECWRRKTTNGTR
ncbi:Coiled-coil-helix-coiled-coil-helix domain-containing protein C550.01c [Taphrina deformans PYCC 5710]|uniref:Coiled-coil-helix-coiled-coil-helix domain-containing protein C550.01c n=1 Tax=Taphrina deformans (strain PYCC 5710 / ATCC 11124 / CBS 356.35 / IMI 108563 / JCM 9778 / NBRC 8474) TaxID=1097556 RepID=R4XAS3_TAPDE|nr:Coiled-coil-helix-coiled-coil-helix domain-containing protein C550.01c [Taphrina deformans PYCC 5710]|eukprot:CCG82959.1 Coiled-coil-helix-coiled-coil-helix domain-containing protein C550.01c [Taphrina deformans PYCC 5710]